MVVISVAFLMVAIAFLIVQSPYVQKKAISYVTQKITEKTGAQASVSRIKVALFKRIVFEDVFLSDQAHDTLVYSQKVVAVIDSLSLKRKSIHLNSIELRNPKLRAVRESENDYNFSFLLKTDTINSPNEWKVNCNKVELKNGQLFFSETYKKPDENIWFHLSDINIEIDDVQYLSENTFSFSLKKTGFVSHDGFYLKNVAAGVTSTNGQILADNIIATTQYSSLFIDTLKFDASGLSKGKPWYDCMLDVNLKQLDFNFQDIAFIFPQYASEGVDVSFSGHISGKFSELRGKRVRAKLGEVTRLTTDFYFNGLPDIDNTYMFANLYESYANLDKIRDMELPQRLNFIKEKMPLFFKNIGEFSYQGNFTGFKNDFVAYGTAYSNLGVIETDIAFKPDLSGKLLISGNLSTTSLDIGKILETERLSKLTLSGKIGGNIHKNRYNIVFNGVIDSVEINDYKYSRVDLNGNIQNKLFNGDLYVKDPNLEMSYSGRLDLSGDIPMFEFVSGVTHASLGKLNLVNDSLSEISVNVDANFKGDNIDNLIGNIEISDLYYKNKNDSLKLSNAQIKSDSYPDKKNRLVVKSDWVDGNITGEYSFLDITSSLVGFLQKYLPSSYDYGKSIEQEKNKFSFSFNFKNTDMFTRVFIPGLDFETPFEIRGFYDPLGRNAMLESTLPYVSYKNRGIERLFLKLYADEGSINCRAKTDVIHISEEFKMYNFSIDGTGANDELDVDLFWNNYGVETYSGIVKTNTTFKQNGKKYPIVKIDIEPSKIYIADSLWQLDESTVTVDSTSVKFDRFALHNNNQRFLVDGKLCENTDSKARASIQNIDFQMIQSVFGANNFKGLINGKAELTDPYNQFILQLKLSVDNLLYKENELGNLQIESNWDNAENHLNTKLSLFDSERELINGKGTINPVKNNLDLELNFDNTPFALLEITKPNLFYNLQGHASGKLHVHGETSNLLIDGKLTPSPEVGIGFRSIKTTYLSSDAAIFSNDSLIFPNMSVKDEYDNPGLFYGSIKHRNFSDMVFDLTLISDNFLAINTTYTDNNRFYGTAFVNGSLTITGQAKDIVLSGNFRSEKGTAIYIPFERAGKAVEYDFITFVNSNDSEEISYYQPETTNGISMNFDMEITPDAKVQLIFNSRMGDIIRGEGSGNMQVNIDPDFNVELYGDYIIEEGDYLFTLENILNKRFSINPGSSIKWMGDPYNAELDITAIYKVKTSLYDLFLDSYQDEDFKRRIPVDCIILLKDNLRQPTIDFEIELPTAEARLKDQVKQIIATEEDVNKQVISLLMLGRFYTPEFFMGQPTTEAGVELVGTTASELISNQLSNWLSQIFDEWNIGINYRPGNEISNDQVELALSTQILDDRVTIDGNIANNANPTTKRSGDFVGDFDLNIKLTDNGKLQFKAYTHSNDDLIYDTAPTTQGIGFIYREEFNSFKGLMEYYKRKIFKKKPVDKKDKGKSEK